MASASQDESIEQLSRDLVAGARGLAHSARRLNLWRASLWCVSASVAALGLLAVGDMLWRREETGLRILFLATWLAVVAICLYRWWRPAWYFAPSPLDVAQWVESRQQPASGQLTTVVELASLPADETRYGSRGFREAALRQWASKHPLPQWRAHLDLRPLRRAVLACAAVCGLLLAVSLVWPQQMRVALARLAFPWAAYDWPRRDQLAFRELPSVVALGSELQLEVFDSAPPLPEQVEIHTRLVGSSGPLPMSQLPTVQVNEVAVGNLPPVTTAIEVRAVGGDDHFMPWQRIEVVPPPELTQHRFVVQPPAYTGMPTAEVVGRRLGVLAGSRVEFHGEFNEPMQRVVVQLAASPPGDGNAASDAPAPEAPPIDDAATGNTATGDAAAAGPTAAGSRAVDWVARLDRTARQFRIAAADGQPAAVDRSLSWQLAIVTSGGLEMQLPELWRIEVTQDAPPQIAFQSAALAQLATGGQLAIRGSASDDLGLVQVIARMLPVGDETAEPLRRQLWSADGVQAAAGPGGDLPGGDLPGDVATRELAIEGLWDMSQAASLVAGQRIAVWLEAQDSGGQWGRSEVQEFAIRNPQELVEALQQQQHQLLGKVRELVDTQRRNSQLFSRADQLVQDAGRVAREQLEQFRHVAQVQRAIANQFQTAGGSDTLRQEVVELRELLDHNQLAETELASELATLENMLTELAEGPLRQARQGTQSSLQRAQETPADERIDVGRVREINSQTTAAMAAAQQGLERLLDRLARNEAVQEVQRELAQIVSQQESLRRQTDQLQLERLSSAPREQLQAQQTALGADQQGLARRLDDLVQRASQLQAAAQEQPALQAQLERANDSLIRSQASAKMRRSTEEIRSDKLAQAAATQQEVSQLLNQTLQQLGAGNTSQLGNLQHRADGLRHSQQELSQLAEQQADVAQQWRAAEQASAGTQVAESQRDLQQRTASQAQQASQTGDAQLAGQIGQAVDQQQAAERAGQAQDFQQAAEAASRAAEHLADSAEQLRQRAEQLEQEVAAQQINQLHLAINGLAEQQRPVAEEFGELAQAAEEPDRQQRQSEIRQAAARQEGVRQTLRDVRSQTSQLPTFDWTLEQAELSMSRAVAAAQRYRVQPDALQASADALRLLELVVAAMQQATAANNADATQPDEREPDSSAGEPPSEDEPSRPLPMLASLKLLRGLQQEINQRTEAAQATLDATRRNQQLGELSLMQQALGTQMERLLRELAASLDTGE